MSDVQKKILIVDDDSSILEVLTLLFEEEGYKVKATNDAKIILNLDGDIPHLILLDIWLSGWDGSELCRHLKGNNDTKNIPVILLSANKDTHKIAKDVGADNFVCKPFDIHHLTSLVRKYIDN